MDLVATEKQYPFSLAHHALLDHLAMGADPLSIKKSLYMIRYALKDNSHLL